MQARSEDGTAAQWAQWFADAICDRPSAWARLAEIEPAVVMRAAERHGVVPLLASRAPSNGSVVLGGLLHAESIRAAAQDAIATRALAELTCAFREASIDALVFKGADLAYSCYSDSYLRPRVDADVLIRQSAHAGARDVLTQVGYRPVPQSGGDLLMYQEPYVRVSEGRILHTVDLHWRAANPQQFGDVAPFEDLWAASEARPRISAAARGLAPVHAFALACVHRVAHHYDDERLIWTYDLHQIATKMAEADWEHLTAWASMRHIAAACARGIALTSSLFNTVVPAHVTRDLADAAAQEPAARPYLVRGRHVERILTDFALMPSWTARARLARQHVFPPKRYMRDVYAPGSALPVAILYMQRVWRGARRWMART